MDDAIITLAYSQATFTTFIAIEDRIQTKINMAKKEHSAEYMKGLEDCLECIRTAHENVKHMFNTELHIDFEEAIVQRCSAPMDDK